MHCHLRTTQKPYHNLNTFCRCLLVVTSFKVIGPLANFHYSNYNAMRSQWSFFHFGTACVHMEQSLVSSPRGHPAAPPTACTLQPTPRTLLHFCFVKQQSLLKLTEDVFSSGTTVLCDQAMQVVGRVKDSGKRTISKSITSCNLFHAYIILLVWFHFCKLAV